jgi:hypothetical protein
MSNLIVLNFDGIHTAGEVLNKTLLAKGGAFDRVGRCMRGRAR